MGRLRPVVSPGEVGPNVGVARVPSRLVKCPVFEKVRDQLDVRWLPGGDAAPCACLVLSGVDMRLSFLV